MAILDADKEGFLRSETSLIQMIGRTARNVNAEVILYADAVTPSMQQAIRETNRRRELQVKYNADHGITPETIRKEIRTALASEISARRAAREALRASEQEYDRVEMMARLEQEMLEAAESLEFERAATLRDRLKQLKEAPVLVGAGGADERPEQEDEPATGKRRGSSRGGSDAASWQPRSRRSRRSRSR